MAPSGLYARLCHAFLVLNTLLDFAEFPQTWAAQLGEWG